ncbi:M24 family metallopeptidase [Peptacetobacter sp.]|uniref:M24 family metallopeptidase n=1 Tax=Peptacetobacter sp. TaxID=2991975 RepID=UPI0026211CD9|nr:M24 family metallopeptidase [Peptacetobacter sp.]
MNLFIEKMRKDLNENEAILAKSKDIKKYLNTLEGSGVEILILKKKIYLIMDGRYIEDAKKRYYNNKNIYILKNDKKTNIEIIKEICKNDKINKLKVEYNAYKIKEYMNLEKLKLELENFDEEFKKIRMIKTKNEIEIIMEACEITDKVFENVINNIKIGMTEREISALVQYYSIKFGASKMSFDPVISSGKRTAYPHARPSDKKIEKNDFIMLDFGIEYRGYQSDMTRMIFIGKPNKKIEEIYNIVLNAQLEAIKNIKIGEKCKNIDKISRNIIKEFGYGDYFVHGLGHGIGINNGDEYPKLNKESEMILQEGMIMSCEPGIYLPNIGGIRIEDDVCIINGKAVSLNKTTKKIIVLENKDEI